MNPRTHQDLEGAVALLESTVSAVRAEEARLVAVGDEGGNVVTERTGVGADAHRVVEMWSTTAEYLDEHDLLGSDEGAQDVASAVAERVVPALLGLISTNSGDETDWSVHKAASISLMLWTSAGGSAVCSRVLASATSMLSSPRWKERNAALHAVGSAAKAASVHEECVDHPLLAELTQAVMACGALDDDVAEIRDSTVYCLAEVARSCPMIVMPIVSQLAEVFVSELADPDIRVRREQSGVRYPIARPERERHCRRGC